MSAGPPTMTLLKKSTRRWDGETGRITASLLTKATANLTAPIYYVVGPLGMVTGMRTLLKEMGVVTQGVRTEAFAGY